MFATTLFRFDSDIFHIFQLKLYFWVLDKNCFRNLIFRMFYLVFWIFCSWFEELLGLGAPLGFSPIREKKLMISLEDPPLPSSYSYVQPQSFFLFIDLKLNWKMCENLTKIILISINSKIKIVYWTFISCWFFISFSSHFPFFISTLSELFIVLISELIFCVIFLTL